MNFILARQLGQHKHCHTVGATKLAVFNITFMSKLSRCRSRSMIRETIVYILLYSIHQGGLFSVAE
jgi:hypothetical protein